MGEFHLPLIASNLKSNGYLLLIHGLNDFETPGGGGTPYNCLYRDAPTERGIFCRLQVYERVSRDFTC